MWYLCFVYQVLTYNRAGPLRRLLASLAAADYGGDVVDLEIWCVLTSVPAGGGLGPAADCDRRRIATGDRFEF